MSSHTALDNWQGPLEADSPDWQSVLQHHVTLLKNARDKVAFDYQKAGKNALAGHAADKMGELTDKLCDLISEYEDDIEALVNAGGGEN